MKHVEMVVPCYNEQECIRVLYEEIDRVFHEYDNLKDVEYSILFVNDGSKDHTLDEIKQLAQEIGGQKIHYVSFARNFGKESAIYAGLAKCQGDYIVLMDADLQHPPSLIPQMLAEIENGYDCCGARRVSRKGEPLVRSCFSRLFYKVVNRVTCMELVPGGSDYRMMTRQMVDAVLSLSERERFIKGIMSWVGFETKWIEYENVERFAGKTKWSFMGLGNYAVNGFFAFATTPLRAVVWLGVLIVLVAAISAIRLVVNTLIHGTDGAGFVTLVVLILFFNGVIITILGVIGEYMARIYLEIKHRPIYIEKETNVVCEEQVNE